MMPHVWVRGLIVGGALAAAGSVLGAPFIPGDLVVSRIGDGSAALTSAATAVFLDEYSVAGGAPVQSLALPIVAASANHVMTNSGTATSEGTLSRSVDGKFLTLIGYDAAPGTASVAGSSVARVITVVAATGAMDSTTALTDAYGGNNPRSVISPDGASFYTGGTATSTGGVRYVSSLGATTSVQLASTPTNTRVVNTSGGQLYVSAASGTFQGVCTVGSGLPTTNGQSVTPLPGFPTATGPSAYDFFFASPNTLYVADDRATASGGGLQKWVLDSGTATWGLSYTLSANLTAGLRGLTGTVDGVTGQATLYGISADTLSKLVTVTDAGSTSVFTTLATAAPNTAFRGVDFAPVAAPEPGTLAIAAVGGIVLLGRRRRSVR